MELTRREMAAYAAGIMDGEGVFNISKQDPSDRFGRRSPGYYARVIVAMVDNKAIEALCQHWGGKITLRHSARAKRNGWQPIFYWRLLEKKRVEIFLKNVMPFLIIKKPQGKLMLRFVSECKIVKATAGHKGMPRVAENELVARETYYQRMKILNGALLGSSTKGGPSPKAAKLLGQDFMEPPWN